MKKLLQGIFIVAIIFVGTKFGMQTINSFEREKSVLPAVTESNSSDEVQEVEEKPAAGEPSEIRIPKINVSAEVESAGLDSKRNPILPKNADNVVWYNLGPRPGNTGSSVISGHYDKESGAPAVFYELSSLQAGDEIVIEDKDAQKHVFIVKKKVEYPFDKVPLQEIYAAKTDKSLLNLITCSGTWNASSKLYSSRTVVYAELQEN
jgi:sortase A